MRGMGSASGVCKSTCLTPVPEDIRNGRPCRVTRTKPRDYRPLLHVRSRRSVRKIAQEDGENH